MGYFKNTTVWECPPPPPTLFITLVFLKVEGQNLVALGYFDVLSNTNLYWGGGGQFAPPGSSFATAQKRLAPDC